jgi:D-glycero-D-manno-heptose 1,7-bisphosphate phosphatase
MDLSKPGLLILDKDWTLIKPVKEGVFPETPWDQKPIDNDMVFAIAHLKNIGFEIVVASNQAGVEAGHKTLEEVFLEMRFLKEMFPEISDIYFCPDFSGRTCWRCWDTCKDDYRIIYTVDNPFINPGIRSFRKPEPGMLQLALDLHEQVDGAPIIYVGDRPEDQQAAQRANVEFCWAQEFPKKIVNLRNDAATSS